MGLFGLRKGKCTNTILQVIFFFFFFSFLTLLIRKEPFFKLPSLCLLHTSSKAVLYVFDSL